MKNYMPILKQVPLFNEIEESNLNTLLHCLSAKILKAQAKTTIFSEGDSSESVGIVLSGEVQIVKHDYFGNRNIVASINEAELFGEAFACSDIISLPVHVYTTKDSTIMLINYRKILTTCSNCCQFHNKLIYNMLRIMANKNIFLNQKMEILSKRTTREKLLHYFSQEAKKSGNNSFTISFNRQELADYLFIDRSAMSNELSKLRKEGLLEFHKNEFKLL